MFENMKTVFFLVVLTFLQLLKTNSCSANNSDPFIHHNLTTTVTFTTNVTKVENEKPFLGSCKIENFADHALRNYTIKYYRTSTLSRTLIAIHELSAPTAKFPTQRHIFDFVRLSDMIVHPGPHFTYPLFDVVITPTKVTKRENYWCEVEDQTKSTTTTSNIWANTPILALTISSLGDHDYLAQCGIQFYSPNSNRTYAVQLFISNHLAATFHMRPNQSEEFIPEEEVNYRNVRHGVQYTLPTFDFIYYYEYNSETSFNCKLVDGTPGQADYEVFTSNEVDHI